jgi:hypothetical protein
MDEIKSVKMFVNFDMSDDDLLNCSKCRGWYGMGWDGMVSVNTMKVAACYAILCYAAAND